MELFDCLMTKKGHPMYRDLFSYLLGKNAGGSGTYTTFSGTLLNISNTIKAKIKNFMLNSTELTQDGTPSSDSPQNIHVITGSNNVKIQNQNLFKPYTNTGSVTSNTVTYTMNSDNTITINGTATGNTWVEILEAFRASVQSSATKYLNLDNTKNYTIKANIISGTYTGQARLYTQINSTGGEVYGTLNNAISISNSDGLYRTWFRIYSGDVFNNLKLGIQLKEGTATEYVEHQEQNYPITLSSPNILSYISSFPFTKNGVTFNKNNDGTLTLNGTASTTFSQPIDIVDQVLNGVYSITHRIVSGTTSVSSYLSIQKTGGTNISDRTFGSNNVGTITTEQDTTIISASLYITNGTVFDNFTVASQLQLGEATNYVAYQPTIEYCKIGNYADQIFKNTTDSPYYDNTLIDNEWYLKKNIGKATFDGSEEWGNGNVQGGYYSYFLRTDIIKLNSNNELLVMSDRFVGYANPSDVTNTSNVGITTRPSTSGQGFYIRSNLTNINDWILWLTENKPKVYYVQATPTYIHISESDYPILKAQLDNLYNNAQSYEGTTNITQTNDGLPFNLSVDVSIKEN